MENKKYYISTAIAYTSGKPHIGNTYEIILADAIARFKRKDGYDVYFQTGTDEHGEKIELKAKDQGKTPKKFVDEVYHIENDNLFQLNPAEYPTIPDYIIQLCNNHVDLMEAELL